MDIAEAMQSQRDSDLMKTAAEEITHLREINTVMRAKLEMFNDIMSLVRAVLPTNNKGGMMESGMDIVYHLKERSNVLKVIETMHPNENKPEPPQSSMAKKLSP